MTETGASAKVTGTVAILNEVTAIRGSLDSLSMRIDSLEKKADSHAAVLAEIMTKFESFMQIKAASAAKKTTSAAKNTVARAAPKTFPGSPLVLWQLEYKKNRDAFLAKYLGNAAKNVDNELKNDPGIRDLPEGISKLNSEFNYIWKNYIYNKPLLMVAQKEFADQKAIFDKENAAALETAISSPEPAPTSKTA